MHGPKSGRWENQDIRTDYPTARPWQTKSTWTSMACWIWASPTSTLDIAIDEEIQNGHGRYTSTIPHVANSTAPNRGSKRHRGCGGLLEIVRSAELGLLRRRAVHVSHQVRLGHGLAPLLPARRRRRPETAQDWRTLISSQPGPLPSLRGYVAHVLPQLSVLRRRPSGPRPVELVHGRIPAMPESPPRPAVPSVCSISASKDGFSLSGTVTGKVTFTGWTLSPLPQSGPGGRRQGQPVGADQVIELR